MKDQDSLTYEEFQKKMGELTDWEHIPGFLCKNIKDPSKSYFLPYPDRTLRTLKQE